VIGSAGSMVVRSGGFLSVATIAGGTLEIESGGVATKTISFAGGGTLVLDDARLHAKIAGFNATDPDAIDLTTIDFATATLGYSGNTLSGTLTVSDGVNTTKIAMLGNYVLGNFHKADDSHGGTLITDPAVDSGGLAPPH
jgi:autotransporter passenger strand-loop-strand repeat protein